ncbi:hypothetical protein J132_09340 [Termitomyces sp. J132]|nr:hypothetical protein J132_09340 [Termitomyces sp. J132]
MVQTSFRQWLLARKLGRKYEEFGWTEVHGFSAIMNGFQNLRPGSDRYSTIHPNDLEFYLRTGDITITEDELKDKSKGDWFSKSIIILQVTWFILQILMRVMQHLVITELEIATCAFAILNFMTCFFWRNKPLDVDCPITIPAYHEPGNWDAGSSSFQDRLTPEVPSSSARNIAGNLIVGRDLPLSRSQFESIPSNSKSSRECDDNTISNHFSRDVAHLNANRSRKSSESFEDQASNSAKDNSTGYTSNNPDFAMSPALPKIILPGPCTLPYNLSDINVPSPVAAPVEGIIRFHNKNALASNDDLQVSVLPFHVFNPLGDLYNLQSYHKQLLLTA